MQSGKSLGWQLSGWQQADGVITQRDPSDARIQLKSVLLHFGEKVYFLQSSSLLFTSNWQHIWHNFHNHK